MEDHKVKCKPNQSQINRRNPSEVFLGRGVLKICSTFTGEHSCLSAISIKLLTNFIEITLRHGCSPVNYQNIFLKNTSGGLLLNQCLVYLGTWWHYCLIGIILNWNCASELSCCLSFVTIVRVDMDFAE